MSVVCFKATEITFVIFYRILKFLLYHIYMDHPYNVTVTVPVSGNVLGPATYPKRGTGKIPKQSRSDESEDR